jgi:hypothetical protein
VSGTLFGALGRQPSGTRPIETDTGVTLGPSETEPQIVERLRTSAIVIPISLTPTQGARQSATPVATANLFAFEGGNERADVEALSYR